MLTQYLRTQRKLNSKIKELKKTAVWLEYLLTIILRCARMNIKKRSNRIRKDGK